eukprot:scaffold23462_cov66-Phaeocystis_antarctica.AAC.10
MVEYMSSEARTGSRASSASMGMPDSARSYHSRARAIWNLSILRLFRHAKPHEVLPRQVDPLAGAVLSNVTQDVGQLQRDAQRQRRLERLLQRRILRGAHDREHHEPHGARHAVAVHVQLVERFEAVLVEVHDHTLDHVLERLDGKARVVAQRVDQRQVDRVVRDALPKNEPEPVGPICELIAQARRVLARLVDDVVGASAPGIHSPHRLALRLVEELGAEVESLGVVRSDLAALLVRLLQHLVMARLGLGVPQSELLVRRQDHIRLLGVRERHSHIGCHGRLDVLVDRRRTDLRQRTGRLHCHRDRASPPGGRSGHQRLNSP